MNHGSLIHGEGGGKVADALELGPPQAAQKLPGLNGEGFEIAAPPLPVECVECQRGFSGAGNSRHRGQGSERDLQIDPLEVVLAPPLNDNAVFLFLSVQLAVSFFRYRMAYMEGTTIKVRMVAKERPNIMVQESGFQKAALSPPQ